MTQWTKKYGLTDDSMGPTLHLAFEDFRSEADFAAFGNALAAYPDILPEIIRGAIESWRGYQDPATGQWIDDEAIQSGKIAPGALKPRAQALAEKCAKAAAAKVPVTENNTLNPKVAEAIAQYARWSDAGKPVDGIQ